MRYAGNEAIFNLYGGGRDREPVGIGWLMYSFRQVHKRYGLRVDVNVRIDKFSVVINSQVPIHL